MVFDERTRLALPLILRITVIGTLAAAIYGHFIAVANGAGGAFDGVARGLLTGAVISASITTLEIYVLSTDGNPLGRAPFLLHLALKSIVYVFVFVLGSLIGVWLLPDQSSALMPIGRSDILFFVAICFVINFLLEINRLLGQNVLVSFVTGRYYRPRVEQRIFLIIDMKNSTAAAERLGEVDFLRLLNRFVSDLTSPLVLQNGQIHKYVGDELIVTWPLAEGLRDVRCLRAYFAAATHLDALGPTYERDFGFRVEFRAGLHCGPVVVGEMGTVKKEIALIGDTLNTAARIVDACRDSGEAMLASATLLQQLTLPPDIVARSLGSVQLRGKQSSVELAALQQARVG